MLSTTLITIIVILQCVSIAISIYSALRNDYNPYYLLIETGLDSAIAGLMFVQVLIQPEIIPVLIFCIWGIVVAFDFVKADRYRWKGDDGNYAI